MVKSRKVLQCELSIEETKFLKEICKILIVMYKNNIQCWAIFRRGPFSVNSCQLCDVPKTYLRLDDTGCIQGVIYVVTGSSETPPVVTNYTKLVIYLSIYLFIFLSIYLPTYVSFYISLIFICYILFSLPICRYFFLASMFLELI